MADRATANLPSRDFDATIAFYGALGFTVGFHDSGWLILNRGALELEFFPHSDLDKRTSWFSACIRVDDLDGLLATWREAGLSRDARSVPRLTDAVKMADVPRMFALVDDDGSLLRVLENEG